MQGCFYPSVNSCNGCLGGGAAVCAPHTKWMASLHVFDHQSGYARDNFSFLIKRRCGNSEFAKYETKDKKENKLKRMTMRERNLDDKASYYFFLILWANIYAYLLSRETKRLFLIRSPDTYNKCGKCFKKMLKYASYL